MMVASLRRFRWPALLVGLMTVVVGSLLFAGVSGAARPAARLAAAGPASIVYSAGLVCTHSNDSCSGIPRFNKSIYVIDRPGSAPSRITTGTHADDRAPVWSPDHRRIAFQRTDNTSGGVPQVWVMNADGSSQKALIRGGSVTEGPYWLADGKRLLFTGFYGNGGQALYRVNADGSGLRRLAGGQAGTDIGYVNASPDGRKIAFATDDGGYVVNVDGTGLNRLLPKSGSVSLLSDAPVWAPSGRTLVFVRNDRLWVMKPDGSAQRKLAPSLTVFSRPVWSPTGARIAYTGVDGTDAFRLVVVNADGTGQRMSRPGVEGVPNFGPSLAWSPTGTSIAFIVHGRITVMNPDGTGIKAVTSAQAGYGIFGLNC